jgi:uncharacterized membrane protein
MFKIRAETVIGWAQNRTEWSTMANSDGKPHDNRVMLFRSLAGALMGIAIGVSVARDWPSAAGWLKYLGLLSALVFLVLAQSRSKKLGVKTQ